MDHTQSITVNISETAERAERMKKKKRKIKNLSQRKQLLLLLFLFSFMKYFSPLLFSFLFACTSFSPMCSLAIFCFFFLLSLSHLLRLNLCACGCVHSTHLIRGKGLSWAEIAREQREDAYRVRNSEREETEKERHTHTQKASFIGAECADVCRP